LWNKLWSNKEHGKSYKAVTEKNSNKGFRFVHESFGSNYRMTEMQAVIGRIQLKKMHSWHLLRLKNANIIWSCAKKLKGLRVPKLYPHIEHAAYKCYVFVNQNELSNSWTRDLIMQEINSLGVPCYSGSCSEVYLEKAFNKNRPKMGFGVPIDVWLRGPLKSWSMDLLDENLIRNDGYFKYDEVIKIWKEHDSQKFNHQHKLWNILMFQSWLHD
ncbi:asparagine synthase-related protein, partial [Candidatus Thioglobus sp.]|nr:asparagine synthase-related protein [Candidatus Thioglobus sp.]